MSGSHAYVNGGFKVKGCLDIADISDPYKPILTGSFDDQQSPSDAKKDDVVVKDDFAYVADLSSGLQVVDISNPVQPLFKGSSVVPDSYPLAVAVISGYAYVTAKTNTGGVFQVIDVSIPDQPFPASSIQLPEVLYQEWNGVAVSGDYAYVINSWDSNFVVINIMSPTSPLKAGSCDIGALIGAVDAKPQSVFACGDGKYVYVAAWSGLQVINVSNPNNPILESSYDPPNVDGDGVAMDVAVSGGYAYMLNDYGDYEKINVIDVTHPSKPTLVASTKLLRPANDLFVKDNVIYLTGDYFRLSNLFLSFK